MTYYNLESRTILWNLRTETLKLAFKIYNVRTCTCIPDILQESQFRGKEIEETEDLLLYIFFQFFSIS